MTEHTDLPLAMGPVHGRSGSHAASRVLSFPGSGYQQGMVDATPEGTISLMDVFRIIKRNLLLGIILVGASAVILYGIASTLTPLYKSPAVVQIQSSYFRAPLVNDLITEEHDHGELMSRRGSLVKIALNNEFLFSLYERFPQLKDEVGLEDPFADDLSKAQALYALRERIESFSLGGSTHHIAAVGSSPSLAQELSTAVVERLVDTLKEEREGLLVSAREAIAGHVRELAGELNAIEESIRASDEEGLSGELRRAKADLEALLVHYTEKHPKVFKLKQEAQSLENRLKALQAANLDKGISDVPRSEAAKEPTQDVYNELLKKLSYLKIALSLEQEESEQHVQIVSEPSYAIVPYFPNKKLFVLLGVVIGFVLWVAIAANRELSRMYPGGSKVETAAEASQLLFLGKLPELDKKARAAALPERPFGTPPASGMPGRLAPVE